MQVEWQVGALSEWRADAVLFFGFEEDPEPPAGFGRWLREQGSWLAASTALKDFKGELGQVAVYYGPNGSGVPRVVHVGLGPRASFDLEKWRGAVASGVRRCAQLSLARPALPLPACQGIPLEPTAALEEAVIGAVLGLYRYDALKTKKEKPNDQPETLLLLTEEAPGEPFEGALRSALATAAGILLARDLTIAPANEVTPSVMAETARQLAQTYGFHLDLIDLDKARSLGMGAFVAVAQGSREAAFMVILEHAPAGTEQDRPLVLVGKGITFDTGGISIKPSAKMEIMKHDMAGAAAVLGALEAIGRLGLQRRVVGILPCTENMPDGKAYKPGDVIRSLSGQTIEVISTDAEGRMVLADALTHGAGLEPAGLIDLATLTGACIVALGNQVGAVFSNRDALGRHLQEAGTRVGERLWPLPLWDFYFEGLKSTVADFRNVATDRSAGTIIGGMFLKQFVPEEIPWAHLDIAGPAWAEKDAPTAPKGATGFGVRILLEAVRRWDEWQVS